MDKIAKFLPFLAWIHEIKDKNVLVGSPGTELEFAL